MPKVMCCVALMLSVVAALGGEPDLVPWPKSIKMGSGFLEISKKSRIVIENAKLEPLARIFSDEINIVTGVRMATGIGRPGKGDIGLSFDETLVGEAYKIVVSENAVVQGGNYNAVAMGTVTLLQALKGKDNKILVPRMSVADEPETDYRGLMIDVARQFHSIENLKQCVKLCRLYKTRYLQLHLTDDQAFCFPSTKFADKLKGSWKLDELKDLVKFADERGVTIIPEFDSPGHSSALREALPDLVGGPDLVDFLKPTALPTMETLINEMCDVFKSSPYFHIGADECQWPAWEALPHVAKDRVDNNTSTQKQFGKYINQLNAIVKKNGKKTLAWEGFVGTLCGVDKDVIVMEFENYYYPPPAVVGDGYQIINASWTPLYVVVGIAHLPAEIYAWNKYVFKRFGAAPWDEGFVLPITNAVVGVQVCAWEQPEVVEIPNERYCLPSTMERVWNSNSGKTYEDFARRLTATDRLLDLLISGLSVKVDGLTPRFDNWFDKEAVLTFMPSPSIMKAKIRYTLDGEAPTAANSILYEKPIRLKKTAVIQAAAFDVEGRMLGYPLRMTYQFHPVTEKVEGLNPDGRFTEAITVKLSARVGGEIRYTVDGSEPTTNSPVYAGPIKIEKKSTTVCAALFADGKKVGEGFSRGFVWFNYEKNLTTGKPVTVSQEQGGTGPQSVVDGSVMREKGWSAYPYPQWLQIDLEKVYKLNKVHVFPYWDGARCYQYNVELSTDGKTWTKVADASTNTTVATDQGMAHEFAPTDGRYVRVNMLKDSVDTGVHLVEVRVYEAKDRRAH